jgi:hypothetical protein
LPPRSRSCPSRTSGRPRIVTSWVRAHPLRRTSELIRRGTVEGVAIAARVEPGVLLGSVAVVVAVRLSRVQRRRGLHVTTPTSGVGRVPCRCSTSCSTCSTTGGTCCSTSPTSTRRAHLLDLELDGVGVVVAQNLTDTPGCAGDGRGSRAGLGRGGREAIDVGVSAGAAGWSPSTGNVSARRVEPLRSPGLAGAGGRGGPP